MKTTALIPMIVVILMAINDTLAVEMNDPANAEYKLSMRLAMAVCLALVGFLPSMIPKRKKPIPPETR